jgi:hypothetical protein
MLTSNTRFTGISSRPLSALTGAHRHTPTLTHVTLLRVVTQRVLQPSTRPIHRSTEVAAVTFGRRITHSMPGPGACGKVEGIGSGAHRFTVQGGASDSRFITISCVHVPVVVDIQKYVFFFQLSTGRKNSNTDRQSVVVRISAMDVQTCSCA